MKIGFVIDYFAPHSIGGAERSTRRLARALADRGHEVSILTPNYGAPAEEESNGVGIFRYWFPRRVEPGRAAPSFWIKNPLYYAVSGRAIGRLARRLGLQILHAQNTFVQVPAYLAARKLGLPSIATIRDLGSLCSIGHLAGVGGEIDHICSKSYFRCAREFVRCYYPRASLAFKLRFALDFLFKHLDLLRRRRLLGRYSKIVFVSRGLRDVYLRHGFRARPERLAVVYNIPPRPDVAAAAGPPPSEWDLPEGARVVAFVGRMTLGKGADVLLKAVPRVIERRGDVVFVFAGRRSPQVEIPPDIPGRNIRVLGPVPNEQVHALLKRADLFVLPSVWPEPLSSAVFEALAFGVPVVATDRGGTPEQIVNGENGLLVEAGDPRALADKIVEALADPERLRRMARRCREILRERFDPDKIVGEILAIYHSALAEKETGGGR